MSKWKLGDSTIALIMVAIIVLVFVAGGVIGATAFPRTETEYIEVEKVETQFVDKVEYKDRIEYVDRYIYTEAPEPEIEYYSLGMFDITAYCSCEQCCGIYALTRPKDENGNDIIYTASGAYAQPNHTIAVDPSVIPFGTQVVINGITYTAEDTGGLIKGNRIDIYFDSHEAACSWGKQTLEVFVSQ